MGSSSSAEDQNTVCENSLYKNIAWNGTNRRNGGVDSLSPTCKNLMITKKHNARNTAWQKLANDYSFWRYNTSKTNFLILYSSSNTNLNTIYSNNLETLVNAKLVFQPREYNDSCCDINSLTDGCSDSMAQLIVDTITSTQNEISITNIENDDSKQLLTDFVSVVNDLQIEKQRTKCVYQKYDLYDNTTPFYDSGNKDTLVGILTVYQNLINILAGKVEPSSIKSLTVDGVDYSSVVQNSCVYKSIDGINTALKSNLATDVKAFTSMVNSKYALSSSEFSAFTSWLSQNKGAYTAVTYANLLTRVYGSTFNSSSSKNGYKMRNNISTMIALIKATPFASLSTTLSTLKGYITSSFMSYVPYTTAFVQGLGYGNGKNYWFGSGTLESTLNHSTIESSLRGFINYEYNLITTAIYNLVYQYLEPYTETTTAVDIIKSEKLSTLETYTDDAHGILCNLISPVFHTVDNKDTIESWTTINKLLINKDGYADSFITQMKTDYKNETLKYTSGEYEASELVEYYERVIAACSIMIDYITTAKARITYNSEPVYDLTTVYEYLDCYDVSNSVYIMGLFSTIKGSVTTLYSILTSVADSIDALLAELSSMDEALIYDIVDANNESVDALVNAQLEADNEMANIETFQYIDVDIDSDMYNMYSSMYDSECTVENGCLQSELPSVKIAATNIGRVFDKDETILMNNYTPDNMYDNSDSNELKNLYKTIIGTDGTNETRINMKSSNAEDTLNKHYVMRSKIYDIKNTDKTTADIGETSAIDKIREIVDIKRNRLNNFTEGFTSMSSILLDATAYSTTVICSVLLVIGLLLVIGTYVTGLWRRGIIPLKNKTTASINN